MTDLSIATAWKQARAARPARRARPSAAVRLAAWAARTLPTWQRARTAVMQTTAVAAIDYGLFAEVGVLAGCIGLGVGLFVLEGLGDKR